MASEEAKGLQAGAEPAPRYFILPCPLCRHVYECPFVHSPREECIELWPLAKPERRRLKLYQVSKRDVEEALSKRAWLRRLVRRWERGEQVTDEEYLRLRDEILTRKDPVCQDVFGNLIGVRLARYVKDAMSYYGKRIDDPRMKAARENAIVAALTTCSERFVQADKDSPVPSHFERLFFELFQHFLFGFAGVRQIELPEDDKRFVAAFEREWMRALEYGNGFYGLTIVPLVSIVDAVRYQQIGRCDKTISLSVIEYYVLIAKVFPTIGQLISPLFGEKAIIDRVVAMFEPLVRRCAIQARNRRPSDRKPIEILRGEFRSVAKRAIDEYSFMYGKAGTWRDAVGFVGFSSSESLRWKADIAAAVIGQYPAADHTVHVNAGAYIASRLRQHLREHYPPIWDRGTNTVSLDAPLPAAPGAHTHGGHIGTDDFEVPIAALSPRRPVAAVVNGVEYLFINEMAEHCGVTPDQLREWDRSDELPAARLRDVSPAHAGKVSGKWRVYPNTEEMRERIQALKEKKKRAQRGGLREGEYSRKQAAAVLGVHKDTLRRWERRKVAKPQWRDNRPIYTAEEIRRLARLIESGELKPAGPTKSKKKRQHR